MIVDVEGTTASLEPGKHYILLYDVNRCSAGIDDFLNQWASSQGIHLLVVPINGPPDRAISLVRVEIPEKEEVTS